VCAQPIELGEVNAGDSFVLVGSAESRSEVTYKWSVDPQFDPDFSKLVLTDRTSPRLVVRGGALAPGIRYKFKLSATNRDGTGTHQRLQPQRALCACGYCFLLIALALSKVGARWTYW
jgi:hypothetical protein